MAVGAGVGGRVAVGVVVTVGLGGGVRLGLAESEAVALGWEKTDVRDAQGKLRTRQIFRGEGLYQKLAELRALSDRLQEAVVGGRQIEWLVSVGALIVLVLGGVEVRRSRRRSSRGDYADFLPV